MKILVLDIETGNYDPDGDNFDTENIMVCEIGLVSLDTKTGAIDDVFGTACREDQMCNPYSWVFQNTSLKYDHAESSGTLDEIRAQLQPIFDQGTPVTSWGHDFDIRHLEYPSRGFKIPNRFWDPKIVLTDFIKLPSNSGGYKWPKVSEAFQYFNPGVPYYEEHRALEDAKDEAELIYKAMKQWPILENRWKEYV
jgi:DNA polymerase III subunit epsilon